MVERSDYHAERDRLSGIPLRGVEHLSRVTMLSLKVDIISGVFLYCVKFLCSTYLCLFTSVVQLLLNMEAQSVMMGLGQLIPNPIFYMDGWDFTLGTPGIDNQPDAQLVENDQAPGVDDGLPQRRGLDLDYHHDDHRSPLYVGKVQLMDELRYKMKEQLDVIGVKRKYGLYYKKLERICTLLRENSSKSFLEISQDLHTNPTDSPYLKKAVKIAIDILTKKIKDEQLDTYFYK